jgi:hypothetical protein
MTSLVAPRLARLLAPVLAPILAPLVAGALLASGAACSDQEDFLAISSPQTCEQVRAAEDGDACHFFDTCVVLGDSEPFGGCCNAYQTCQAGRVSTEYHCSVSCTVCGQDAQCAAGAAVCEGNLCVPCPEVDRCPPCDRPWQVRVTRNGCAMCECAEP